MDRKPPEIAGVLLSFERPLAGLAEQIRVLETSKNGVDYTAELRELEDQRILLTRQIFSNLTAWETVQVARHPNRPTFKTFVELMCEEFREIHGDRHFGDDPTVRCGLARISKHKVMLIGQERGQNTKERVKHNFGMAHPEGYRKALRCMKLAEKFGLPVVTLIDTPGAYPSIEAEERGQSEAIARNLIEMSRLRTPIVSVVIGSAGSGGALGIGVADRVAMCQFTWYAVISPEGCSAILFRDNDHCAEAAASLKCTAPDLMKLGVIDAIIPEPLGGAHRDPHSAVHTVAGYISKTLATLKKIPLKRLLHERYEKFRAMGVVLEQSNTSNMRLAQYVVAKAG